MLAPAELLLVLIVALAFSVEAAVGFGATIVTVALGSMVTRVDAILPAFVPVNVALSLVLVARHRRHVAARLLGRRVLPYVVAGLPLGFWAGRHADEGTLKLCFGVFVVALSALELSRARGASGSAAAAGPSQAALAPWRGRALLFVGGVVHGAFATGGPMVVYVLGRELGADKARFRATLSLLWLVLNALLVAGFVQAGSVTGATLRTSALFAGALLIGLVLGEQVHRRIDSARFSTYVFGLLGVVGAVIVARAALG